METLKVAKALKVANIKSDLDIQTVLKLLKQFENTQPNLPPFQPKGGDIYLYRPKNSHCKDDWRADGYRWYQNGTKKLPRHEPVINKSYFISVTPAGHNNEFKRSSYKLIGPELPLVLVHYFGDESIAVEAPHGNAKCNDRIFYRTSPSVLKKIAEEKESPENIYKNIISGSDDTPPQYQHSLLPRNMRQVVNIQQRECQKSRLSHDALYNMHELAYDLEGFVKVIKTYPDLIVVCGHEKMLTELNKLLQIDSVQPQLLSYDTTFQLGDFYLSPLLFRHTLFVRSPVVPAIFLIHERKFQAVHDTLMQQVAQLVPMLVTGKKQFPIVTDEENAIIQAIGKYLPQAVRVSCWNHAINAIKVWLKKHGATGAEIPAYTVYVRDLLNQPSTADYNKCLNEYKIKWSKAFYNYFMEEINPKINTSLGRWVLEELDVYSPFTGVTNNQSESFNATLKRLQKRKEVPVDNILLSLYLIQAFYYNEIQRGFAALGEYKLHPIYKSAARSVYDLDLIKCCPLNDIVTCLLGNRKTIKDQSVTNSSGMQQGNHEAISIPSTSLTRARFIVDQGLISHNQSMGVFTVQGTTGNAHAIRLFPTESCTCPATNRCYHILAVHISVGLEDKDKLKKINLTQLRRNSRSRIDKKSGRKAPRLGDLDISPAPDSIHQDSGRKAPRLGDLEISPAPDSIHQDSSRKAPRLGDLEISPAPDSIHQGSGSESKALPPPVCIFQLTGTVPTVDRKDKQVKILPHMSNISRDATFEDDGGILSNFKSGIGRRKRCGSCVSCKARDCGSCRFCKDKIKFGGMGLLRQCCLQRKCKRMKIDETVSSELKSTTKPVVCINHCQVYPKDLETLDGNNWLNDKVVDAYVFLVMDEANKKAINSVYCTSCFFYTKLCNSGYLQVASWIKVNLAYFKKLIVPVHTGNHWCLAVADFIKWELKYYDSLQGDGTKCLRCIQAYLNNVLPSIKPWKILHPKDIPIQTNGYDCGVFVCMYARYQAFAMKFTFLQKDMLQIRAKMRLELEQKRLL